MYLCACACAAVGRPIVDNCLAGYNSSILAYGQTGSGKTYTMLGALPQGAGRVPSDVSISSWSLSTHASGHAPAHQCQPVAWLPTPGKMLGGTHAHAWCANRHTGGAAPNA